MGTRGAVGFRMNEQDKVMYNHFDSYPEGLGVDVVVFIQNHNVEDMKAIFPLIKLVDERSQPTPEEKLACSQWVNLSVSGQSEDGWYCLLRDAQGKLEAYLDEGLRFMIDSQGFLADSLFCEWAYIINLDTENLEVYEGFNKDPDKPGRYAKLQEPSRYDGDPCEYYGVVLIDDIPLSELADMTTDQFEERIRFLTSEEE